MTKHEKYLKCGYKFYENDKIIVYWNPQVCLHVGECVKNSPLTFDVKRRPWIDLKKGECENIAKTIDLCPSGALKYIIKE